MNRHIRHIATTVACAATVGLATLALNAPAQAAETQTSTDGITAIMLSDQEVQDLPSTGTLDQASCGAIALAVEEERKAAGFSQPFDFYTCLDVTRDCIAQTGTHTQVNLHADNTYTCSTYSTDGTLFSQIGGMLFP